jgi:hypothetical protein
VLKDKRLFLAITLLILAVMVFAFACTPNTEQEEDKGDANKNEPAEKQKGVVTEEKLAQMTQDQAPNGCEDCHRKISEEKDYTLAAEANEIEGHPTVKEDATVQDCYKCHSKDSDKPFGKILHAGHLVEGEHYKEKYDSNCINCHKVNDNGSIIVKDLENEETKESL